jgi:hypothetical protein
MEANLPVDASIYNNLNTTPINPLATVSSVTGVQHSLLENQLLQAELPLAQQRAAYGAQVIQGNQMAAQLWAKHTKNGITDFPSFLQDMTQHPYTANHEVLEPWIQTSNNQSAATFAGYNDKNQQRLVSRQEANKEFNQQSQPNPVAANSDNETPAADSDNEPPGIAGSMQPGVQENIESYRKHYMDVQNAANSVPIENAALNNILNISKQNVPSGTMIGQIYESLASTGLAPRGIEDTGAQLKLIQNHASQIGLAGGIPGSDERLQAVMNAKVGDKDLPQVIQNMVPYLLSVNQGKVAQANYYRKTAPGGLSPEKVANAQSNWNQHFDPRLLEMKQLQSDPASLKKFVGGLSKQDKQELLDKWKQNKKLGMME